ncbi:unnamed protein product [Owenia fusiformis]|uniref:Uncharacterized protein n=1 Tax=Owenia fusiformis TaxID=6347 RepID=A0A8S4PTU4_OWEFU|nr:unnamed protein product [Owenia fusiformis]
MLTENEKIGCKELLSNLDENDIKLLKDTVTGKKINAETKSEAINVLVTYSESAEELLKRQRLKRDFLFQYLVLKNVVVPVRAEKRILIQAIIQHWNGHQEIPAQSTIQKPETNIGRDLAYKFIPWFYKMLNANNPTNFEPNEYGAQHFWDDCKLKMVCATPDITEEEHQGSTGVCARLLAFVREERLLFNPNTTPEGTQGHSTAHGLVNVLSCGTIHRNDLCLGVFEQQFGLIRDPNMQDNWRIKFSHLKVRSSQVTQLPTLQDPGCSDLLALEQG